MPGQATALVCSEMLSAVHSRNPGNLLRGTLPGMYPLKAVHRSVLTNTNRIDPQTEKMTGHPRRINLGPRSPGCTTSEKGNIRSLSIVPENLVRDKQPWTRRRIKRILLRKWRGETRVELSCGSETRAGGHRNHRFLRFLATDPVWCKVAASSNKLGLLISTAG